MFASAGRAARDDPRGVSAESGVEVAADAHLSLAGLAREIGKNELEIACHRLVRSGAGDDLVLDADLLERPELNASASGAHPSYAIVLCLPLVRMLECLCLQAWAHPALMPWIGVSDPRAQGSRDDALPGASGTIGDRLVERRSGHPDTTRAPLESTRHLVDAVMAGGEQRWEGYLASLDAAIRFVWRHELAHVLYGHLDLMRALDPTVPTAEIAVRRPRRLPPELSQLMEFTADMDAALGLYGVFYERLAAAESREVERGLVDEGAAIFIGISTAVYGLSRLAPSVPSEEALRSSHPPLPYRALWLQGAESRALDVLERHHSSHAPAAEAVERFRASAREAARTLAAVHPDMYRWVHDVEEGETRAQVYLQRIRAESADYHDRLARRQMI